MRTVRAFYWTGKPNFGDLLTPLLLRRFAHLNTELADIDHAPLVCVGSILNLLPASWSGVVAGTGKLNGGHVVNLPHATILSVRGPLTAPNVPVRSFGDPGILANELVNVDKAHNLGIVPHWSDTGLADRPEFQKYRPLIIDPSGDPLEVLKAIGSCRKIVSSSLHGLIVADAFGIPRRTEIAPRMQYEGGTFKFRDHAAALNLEFEVGVTQAPLRHDIQTLQHRAFDVLEAVGDYFA